VTSGSGSSIAFRPGLRHAVVIVQAVLARDTVVTVQAVLAGEPRFEKASEEIQGQPSRASFGSLQVQGDVFATGKGEGV